MANHRIAEDESWSHHLWSPRLTAEPGFTNRGGSLYSYEYIGKHHPWRYCWPRWGAGWWNRGEFK